MEPNIAQWIQWGITIVAVIAWVAGFVFVSKTARRAASQTGSVTMADEDTEWGAPEQPSVASESPSGMSGTVMVDGSSDSVSTKVAEHLARGQLGIPVRIVRCDADELTFEPAAVVGQTPFSRGRVEFDYHGNSTRVRYTFEAQSPQWLTRAAWGCQAAGALAIVVGYFLTSRLVDHPVPAFRFQAVQMVQVCHFLWPSFLFAGLYRTRQRTAREMGAKQMDSLLNNLAYVE